MELVFPLQSLIQNREGGSHHLNDVNVGVSNWKNIFCCTLSSTWTSGLFLASQALVSPDEPHQDCLNPCLNPSPSVYLPVNIPVPGLIMHNWMVVKAQEQDLPHFVIIVFPDLITRSMLEYMEKRLYNTKINELGLLHHFRWPLYSNKIKTKNKTHTKKRADVLAALPESADLCCQLWCRYKIPINHNFAGLCWLSWLLTWSTASFQGLGTITVNVSIIWGGFL